jgi:hypothetical protein
MQACRFIATGVALANAAWMLVAPGPAAAVPNNLNLIPSRGVQYGIVKRSGHTIHVKLERSRPPATVDLNNSNLRIFIALPGTGAQDVFNTAGGGSTPFNTAFPNGAYAFDDPNHDLYSWRGCVQAAPPSGGGWDGSLVYCPTDGVAKIKITTGPGVADAIQVDPAVTIPLVIKCSGQQRRCENHCLSKEHATCCDQATGCFVTGEDLCANNCP